MEYLGAVSEFNWNVVDESEFMVARLLDTYQDQDPSAGIESMFQPHQDATSCDWLYNVTSSIFSPLANTALSDPNMIPTAETSSESMNIYLPEEQTDTSTLPLDHNYQFGVANTISLEDYSANPSGSITLTEVTPLPKRKIVESGIDKEDEILTETPTKKARTSTQVQKSAKNTRTKKAQKSVGNEEKEESNASYSSENNSNASQELYVDGEGTNSTGKGKTRAGRGSATDPQSLYKRRERINERLRILQNLVPNGTKVDISTMLEEAVQYVNFLQFQIKLLSSDDMWMYAPLAYNGMDIGLNLKIPFPPQGH